MSGLVLELQMDALNASVGTAELLRKALVVTKKLNLLPMRRWIELELGGYLGATAEEVEAAPYRQAHGELKCFNPFHGWQPLNVSEKSLSDMLTDSPVYQSIAEIDDLIATGVNGYHCKFDGATASKIMNMMNHRLEPAVFLPKQVLVRVIDAVRNRVLEWSLDLEAQGILGTGMSFSKEEKIAAGHINYNTTNNIGTMNGSQLQQHSSGSQVIENGESLAKIEALIEAVDGAIDLFKLDRSARDELDAEIATLKTQIASPKPKSGVIRECLGSLKTILEGAAGSMLASGLAAQIPQLLLSLPA